MTNRQISNTVGMLKFCSNIGKLSVGRKTEFWRQNSDGTVSLAARVRCDTIYERPRKFTVMSSDIIPVGGKYTLKTIQRHLLDDSIEK